MGGNFEGYKLMGELRKRPRQCCGAIDMSSKARACLTSCCCLLCRVTQTGMCSPFDMLLVKTSLRLASSEPHHEHKKTQTTVEQQLLLLHQEQQSSSIPSKPTLTPGLMVSLHLHGPVAGRRNPALVAHEESASFAG